MQTPNPQHFNLNYHFNENLEARPDDVESMFDFCAESAACLHEEMEKPESNWEIKPLVSLLGKTAAFLTMLEEYDEALHLIEIALALIEEHQMGPAQIVVQCIRLGDVLRFQGNHESAEEVLLQALEMATSEPTAEVYKDFAFQHLGKLHFSLEEYNPALDLFGKALAIRKLKNDESLINSTEFAIKITKQRLAES